MGSPEEEILPPPIWSKSAMKELVHGQDSVAKLASLLQIGSSENNWPEKAAAGLLIKKIMSSMSKAVAAVESGEREANQLSNPSSCVAGKKDRMGAQSKMQITKKAGYRKRGSPYSWTKITAHTIDDGYTWRKYGQKDIFSAKHPRSYFRCTHKFDRGCRASKQVQRSEDDDSLFVITYFGEHTCTDPRKAIIPSGELRAIRFESTFGENVKHETLSSFPSPNQESEEEALSNISTADSTSDNFVSPEFGFKESAQEQTAAAALGQEHNGLPSPLYSSFLSYGMDFMGCEDFLNFDYNDLFQD